jgi:CRP-like cAMP-binding protein
MASSAVGAALPCTLAMFGPADFFGEGCMEGQAVRMGTATAITPTTLLVVEKNELLRVLHAEHGVSDHFIKYILAHNIRVEEDLVDQLFNPARKSGANTPVACSLRKTGATGSHSAESLAGDSGEHGGNDTLAGELLH